MARQKQTAKIAKAQENRRLAFELRKAGATYEEIGRKLGVTKQSAYEMVTRVLAEIRAKTTEDAEAVKDMEIQRLDAMFKGLWPSAAKGNPQAVEKALKIMERRAKMLGIDSPTKVAPTNPDGTESYRPMSDTEIDNRIRELAGKLGLTEGDVLHGGA